MIASGAAALAVAGICLASGRIDAALVVLAVGLAAVALLSPERRRWTATGFVYAAAAALASVLVRLDAVQGFVALMLILLVVWVTDIGGYFRRPRHRRTEAVAAGQPEEDLGGRDRRLCREPGRCRRLCSLRVRPGRPVVAAWRRFSRSRRSSAICSNPPSNAVSASRIPVTSFPGMAV